MRTEHLDFITFCVGSLSDALNKSASTSIIEKPDVLHSREKLDFGKGFYLTAVREQAVSYADRFILRGKNAFINE